MTALKWVGLAAVAVMIVGLVAAGPDIKRYLKISAM
jgi:hypothetical protein